jgi:uncharacterized protein YodC (DUF2158 family)
VLVCVGTKLILSFSECKHRPKVSDNEGPAMYKVSDNKGSAMYKVSDNKGPAMYIDDVAEILRKFVIGMIKCRTLR